jgi:hypothetical protein
MSDYYSCCIQNEVTKPTHMTENDHQFAMLSHAMKVEPSTSKEQPMPWLLHGDQCLT